MRSFLLFLSRQAALRRWMETSSAARPLSARFIAGLELDDALRAARSVNAQGMSVSLDHLGENISTVEEAARSCDIYSRALTEINSAELNGNVSLKLTQFGLDLDTDACYQNVMCVLRTAARFRNFVRVDMESSAYTDRTLEMVYALYAETKSCGAVIQSYLRRSAGDVDELNRRQIRVRLCKGAYLEPETVAFQDKAAVDANFLTLAQKLLTDGTFPGLATHDEKMIAGVLAFVRQQNIAPERFEFQMLYGVRRDLQKLLVSQGWRMRVYVPFGEAWYPYFMRRLAERPANVLFVGRNLFRG